MNDNSKRARQERDDMALNVGDPVHWIDRERIARRAYEILRIAAPCRRTCGPGLVPGHVGVCGSPRERANDGVWARCQPLVRRQDSYCSPVTRCRPRRMVLDAGITRPGDLGLVLLVFFILMLSDRVVSRDPVLRFHGKGVAAVPGCCEVIRRVPLGSRRARRDSFSK